jgi:hypothetical protein
VAMADANDMSISNSFWLEGKATRTARTIKVARAAREWPLTQYKTGVGCPLQPAAID